jgi:uncharacterized sulfatase
MEVVEVKLALKSLLLYNAMHTGGFRVPLFMRWPGKITAGSTFSPIVSHIDLFPTIMSLIGEKVTHAIDGVNILPYILGAGEISADVPNDTIRDGSDVFTESSGDNTSNLSSVHTVSFTTRASAPPINAVHDTLFWRSGHYSAMRKGFWKIQKSGNPKKVWLFDLEADQGERHNLAVSEDDEHQKKLQEMLLALEEENSQQVDPLWPSVSETPFLIDKVWMEPYEEGDEYVYWPN